MKLIDELNSNQEVHGILVQLPLPDQIDSEKILQAIDPEKDVDGFHPFNVGKMVVGEPVFLPCTPYAIQQMLVRSGIETDGKAYRRIAKEIREMDRDPLLSQRYCDWISPTKPDFPSHPEAESAILHVPKAHPPFDGKRGLFPVF